MPNKNSNFFSKVTGVVFFFSLFSAASYFNPAWFKGPDLLDAGIITTLAIAGCIGIKTMLYLTASPPLVLEKFDKEIAWFFMIQFTCASLLYILPLYWHTTGSISYHAVGAFLTLFCLIPYLRLKFSKAQYQY